MAKRIGYGLLIVVGIFVGGLVTLLVIVSATRTTAASRHRTEQRRLHPHIGSTSAFVERAWTPIIYKWADMHHCLSGRRVPDRVVDQCDYRTRGVDLTADFTYGRVSEFYIWPAHSSWNGSAITPNRRSSWAFMTTLLPSGYRRSICKAIRHAKYGGHGEACLYRHEKERLVVVQFLDPSAEHGSLDGAMAGLMRVPYIGSPWYEVALE